jgi:hypothetical protein
MIVQTTFPVDPETKLWVLKRAYTIEFAGNIKELTREAALEWAKDYPDIFKEYLDEGV